MDTTITITEEQRQLLLLALAHLQFNRPDWDSALNEIAVKMDNVVNGRAAYYDKARKFRTWSVDYTARMEKSKGVELDLSKPRKMRRAKRG